MTIGLIGRDEFNTLSLSLRNKLVESELNLLVKYSDPNFPTIQINENGNWIDLKCSKDYSLKKGEFALIDLGVAMKLPVGFEAHLVPRSGTFKKYGLIQTNSIGIIDNSYSGNNDIWKMPVYALDRDVEIKKGERLCQFRLMPTMEDVGKIQMNGMIIEVETLDSIDRGGFGSTGR